MSHNINYTALKDAKAINPSDRVLILKESLSLDNAGNQTITWEDFLTFISGGVAVSNGLSVSNNQVVLGGTLEQNTTLDTQGNSLIIESVGANPDETMRITFNPSVSGLFAVIEIGTSPTEIFGIVLNPSGAGFVYKPDTGSGEEVSIMVDDESVVIRGLSDVSTDLNVRFRNDSGDTLMALYNAGQLVMEGTLPLDFADDTAAASGGVPLGGVYHNAGELRIRII